jgi:hypothetical protein
MTDKISKSKRKSPKRIVVIYAAKYQKRFEPLAARMHKAFLSETGTRHQLISQSSITKKTSKN